MPTWAIILIVVVVLIAIGITAYFYFSGSFVSKPDPNTQTLINSTLPGGSDASFSTQFHGMTVDAAKQFTFNAVIKGNNVSKSTAGNYTLYTYPGIEAAVAADNAATSNSGSGSSTLGTIGTIIKDVTPFIPLLLL